MDVAVIGSGIAGLGAAWWLSRHAAVTLFDAAGQPGGHAHTVDVNLPGGSQPVDLGFLVYNQATYPNLVALFERLGVPVRASTMTFSASLDGGRREYCGDSLAGLFCQPSNLVRPRHYRMLADILRFYRDAPAAAGEPGRARQSLGDYLDERGYSEAFVVDHLLPMGAAIWSASLAGMRRFPLASFVAFCRNHGLLQLRGRPQWYTVAGGSRRYVEAVLADMPSARLQLNAPIAALRRVGNGVAVTDAQGRVQVFARVVLACHSDQARALLAAGEGDGAETALLARLPYGRNRLVLHTDRALMPRRRRAWAAWNYLGGGDREAPVAVTYWLNALQGLPGQENLFATLNPPIDPGGVLAERIFDHPQLDGDAQAAQQALGRHQGRGGLWFAGAWLGYGFHEDGLSAGLAAAEAVTGRPRPWRVAEQSPAGSRVRPAGPAAVGEAA